MIKMEYFIEGQYYPQQKVAKQLIESGCFSLDPKKECIARVSGIVFSKNIVYIFFPKGYVLSNDDKNNLYLGKLLFKTITKYKNSSMLTEEEASWLGSTNKNILYLDTIKWLITDYLSHGIFSISDRKYELQGPGRIDWNKTIKNDLPFITNNNLIYLNLITHKNENKNSIISIIHENIVLEIIHKFGWLFDLNHPKEKTFINLTIEQQILLLEKELRTTYKTRDIKLIQNLLIYLKDTENNYFSIMLLTPYFYSIWEQMLKLAFKHDSTLMEKVPKPYWYLTGNPFKLYTKQIPDILISKDNTLLIIDAKYYSIKPKNVKKFPGWESIVKQLYYNLSLNNIGFQKIKNIFIMPSSLQPKTYEYLGYSSVEDKENELGLVLAYSLDLQVILESYISGNRPTNILEQLVKDTYLRPN